MMKAIGVDIVKIERIKMERLEQYKQKFLSSSEKEQAKNYSNKRLQMFIASRFCAKEAFLKAKGTGIKSSLTNISVLNDENGKPYIKEHPEVLLSISHEKEFCVAFVVIGG